MASTEAPLRAGQDGDAGRRPMPRSGAEPMPRGEKPLRILVVEDEAIVAMSLAGILEQFGYEVAGTVATGRAAVTEAARLQPDLVLMDVRLADSIDGISAAEQILAEHPVALVFISAYSDQATRERIRALGADMLAKPVDTEALRKAIEAARPPFPGRGSE